MGEDNKAYGILRILVDHSDPYIALRSSLELAIIELKKERFSEGHQLLNRILSYRSPQESEYLNHRPIKYIISEASSLKAKIDLELKKAQDELLDTDLNLLIDSLTGTSMNIEREINKIIEKSISLRNNKKQNISISFLRRLKNNLQKHPRIKLEFSWCFLELGKLDEAVNFAKQLLDEKEVYYRCLSNYICALVNFKRSEFKDCVQNCTTCINSINGMETGISDEELQYVKLAKKMLEEASFMLSKLSGDIKNYVDARKAQVIGDYQKSYSLYKEIKSDVLSEAAALYMQDCLALLGKEEIAIKGYLGIIKNSRAQLYIGEAYLHLAKLYLQKGSVRQAENYLSELHKWIKEANDKEAVEFEHLKKHLSDYPVPSKIFYKDDNGGRVISKNELPEHIINRGTAPWYLVELRRNALHLSIFTNCIIGDKKVAIKYLDELNDEMYILDPTMRPNYWEYERISSEIDRGSFTISDKAWKMLKGANALDFQLAFFYSSLGEDELAAQTLKKIEQGNFASDEFSRGLIRLGKGIGHFRAFDDDKVSTELNSFLLEDKNHPEAPLALLVMANTYTASEETLEKADELYDRIYKSYSGSSIAPKALLAKAMAKVDHGQREIALKILSELNNKYSSSAAAKTAKFLVAELGKLGESEALTSLPQNYPAQMISVHHQNNHVMVPSWKELRSEPIRKHGKSDLIQFKLSCTTTPACIRVDKITSGLTEFEPRLKPRSGKSMDYLRAMALFCSF